MGINKLEWDNETDVIVVGIGASGAVAAINAHDYGAEVIVFEKMKNPGGSSILAGGAVKTAKDVGKAINYLSATQGGRVGNDLINTFAQGLNQIPGYFEELAKIDSAKIATRSQESNGVYPFPGADTFSTVFVQDIPGFLGYSWAKTGKNLNAQRLIKLLLDNIESRNIPIYYDSPVKSLIINNETVVGVEVILQGKKIRVKAKKAVILASGGFEFNEKLKKEYLEAIPVYSMGNPGNTGDGILMAQKAGAALWHMWLIHGSYGFKFPELSTAVRVSIGGARNPERKVPWILVDRRGKRFMNEYHPAPQDTMHRPLEYFDPDLPGYPRIPAILIFDEDGRKLGKIGNPLTAFEKNQYEWSIDNSDEIEQGWIEKFENIEELAVAFNLDSRILTNTIKQWNEQVKEKNDKEFGRPSGTIVSIAKKPFYAAAVWPICTNTQGGPEHDEKQRVLDPYGKPIPHLYAVGELGSFFGHLYLLGGNLSECIISGRIAGREAANEEGIQ